MVLGLLLLACGQREMLAPQIGQAAAFSFSEEKIPSSEGEFTYAQTVSVNETLRGEGTYSWKVGTLSGALPDGVYADESGWIWFRVPGSNSSIALNESGSHRSVWTTQSSLSFEFSSVAGKLQDLMNHVELRVKQADGSIVEHSSAFKSDRVVSSRIVVPFANGEVIGRGMVFSLREVIGDIYVEGQYAEHFMYRVNILNSALEVISAGQWYNSVVLPNMREVMLNSTTTPSIQGNGAGQFTQFESYVVSRSGIEEATHQSVYFKAESGHAPVAVLYSQVLAGLGQHHYGIDPRHILNGVELIPSSAGTFNRSLWFHEDDNAWHAIHSPDLKIHLQWGHHGMYGMMGPGGFEAGGPLDHEYNVNMDANGDEYHSPVVAWDLQLDGNAFPMQQQFVGGTVITDAQNQAWLRVPNRSKASQHCVLSGLSAGQHVVKVRALDAQGVISSNTSTMNITLDPLKTESQRDGILLLDNTPHNSSSAPESYIDPFYMNSVPNIYGPVSRWETLEYEDVSPARLQNYRAVLWYADNPSAQCNLHWNMDALNLYLEHGGKLLISGTNRLATSLGEMLSVAPGFVSSRLGVDSESDFSMLSTSLTTNPFFIRAEGMDGLPDIDLNLSTPFNTIVNLRQGLSSVTYFEPGALDFYSFGFGCKPVDSTVYPPTQQQYDLYSSKCVDSRCANNGSEVWILGFPLSYMEQSDAQSALEMIFAEMLGDKGITRRGK
jgi:hypothetical protein